MGLKLVSAVVRPFKLDDVRSNLLDVGVAGMTVVESGGIGREPGHVESFRGADVEVEVLPKVRIDVLIGDELVVRTVEAIAEAARTGGAGDGRIWVATAESVYRVRTVEEGSDAV